MPLPSQTLYDQGTRWQTLRNAAQHPARSTHHGDGTSILHAQFLLRYWQPLGGIDP